MPLDHNPATPLPALLSAQTWLPPEYAHSLSNHLPMALHALQALGARPERLQQFFGQYAMQHFQAAAATPPAPEHSGPWTDGLGNIQAFEALRRQFLHSLNTEGREALLQATLPVLWPGLAAAAFHGPIRVGHALQAGHGPELAAALAYWAARWQPLPAVAALPVSAGALSSEPAAAAPTQPAAAAAPAGLSLADWAAQLQAARPEPASRARTISRRMAEVSASPAYQALAGALAPAASLRERVQQLASLALPAYAASGDFTLLHAVTGLRAVQVMLPWLEAEGAHIDVSVLDRALVAAWLSTRPRRQPAMDRLLDWPEVMALAVASPDEHVIKLVHACHEQAANWGDAACLAAANRAVQPATPADTPDEPGALR